MFKSKISAVVGFVKKNTTPGVAAFSSVAGIAVAAPDASAASPAPFSLTSALVDPVITALSTNFGVAIAAAFGLMTVVLVGKASMGLVKGLVNKAL